MKRRLNEKMVAKGLLGFIVAQALAVSVGLYQRYFVFQRKAVNREEAKTISDCHNDILYGVIKLLQNPIKIADEKQGKLSISLIGTTSATLTSASTTATAPMGAIGSIASANIDFLI